MGSSRSLTLILTSQVSLSFKGRAQLTNTPDGPTVSVAPSITLPLCLTRMSHLILALLYVSDSVLGTTSFCPLSRSANRPRWSIHCAVAHISAAGQSGSLVATRAARLLWPNTPRGGTLACALRAAVSLVLVRDCFKQLWQRVGSSVHQRQLPQFSVGLHCMVDQAFLVHLAFSAHSGNQKGGVSESVPT